MNPPIDDPRIALTRLRILWVAMLLTPALAFVAMFFVIGLSAPTHPATAPPVPTVVEALHYISIGLLVILLPAGYFIRLQQYKKHWRVNAVAPAGYMGGNLILFAFCEAVMLFSIVVAYVAGTWLPYLMPGVVASMTYLINFPTGKPMEPAEMDLLKRH